MSEKEALSVYLKNADKIEQKWIRVSKSDLGQLKSILGSSKKLPTLHKYYIGSKNNTPIGYVFIDNEIGKVRPITYAVSFDSKFKVNGVEILAFRESHGSQVKNKSFRDQFKGFQSPEGVRLGSKIHNVSGATLSSRAITYGVKKQIAYLNLIKKKLDI